MSVKGRNQNTSGESLHVEVSFDDDLESDGRTNQEQTRKTGKEKTMKKIGHLFLKSEVDIPLTVRDPNNLNALVKQSVNYFNGPSYGGDLTEPCESLVERYCGNLGLVVPDLRPHKGNVSIAPFEDVFAEPDGSHSFDAIWKTSHIVFMESKLCCYRGLTSICAVPCALYWGINFACLSFDVIWFIQPLLRSIQIALKPVASICSMCMRSFVDPCFESCGKMLSDIRLNLSKDSSVSVRI